METEQCKACATRFSGDSAMFQKTRFSTEPKVTDIVVAVGVEKPGGGSLNA
jgi:hypothetical protein